MRPVLTAVTVLAAVLCAVTVAVGAWLILPGVGLIVAGLFGLGGLYLVLDLLNRTAN